MGGEEEEKIPECTRVTRDSAGSKGKKRISDSATDMSKMKMYRALEVRTTHS